MKISYHLWIEKRNENEYHEKKIKKFSPIMRTYFLPFQSSHIYLYGLSFNFGVLTVNTILRKQKSFFFFIPLNFSFTFLYNFRWRKKSSHFHCKWTQSFWHNIRYREVSKIRFPGRFLFDLLFSKTLSEKDKNFLQ